MQIGTRRRATSASALAREPPGGDWPHVTAAPGVGGVGGAFTVTRRGYSMSVLPIAPARPAGASLGWGLRLAEGWAPREKPQ